VGILDRLRGKKKDDDLGLGMDPAMGGGDYGGGAPGYGDPMGSPDMGYGMPPQDPMAQPLQPAGYSPEAMGFERVPPGTPSYPQPGQSQSISDINLGKDMELISAKLDAIKAELDSINQRLKRIERIAEGETPNYKDKWNY
jgi:hypothetical protein